MNEKRPIDILKCDTKPRSWHKMPYLVCDIEVANNASTGIYLLPLAAKLEMFGELVAFCVPIFISPGSHSSGTWGTTSGGGVLRQANLHWDQGTIRHLYCCFEIHPMVLHSLATAFETNTITDYRLELEIAVLQELTAIVNIDPSGSGSRTMLIPGDGLTMYTEGQVKTHDWQDWMKSWGASIEVIYLPKELASSLREIKPRMGVGIDWEVISELLRNYQGEKSEIVLLSSEHDLELKMREIIAGANKELLIMCRAFDETFLTPIIEAQDRGATVKLIAVPIERLREEKFREPSRLTQAQKKASSKLHIKTNISQHARIIVSEQAALVGSTDPDYFGLKIHKNASVFTTNPSVIQAAKLFFNSLWEEAEA